MTRTLNKPETVGAEIAIGRLAANKPYLGDPAVVEDLVRSFIADICERHAEAAGGDNAVAIAGDKVDCKTLARILTGADPTYAPMGPFNTDGGLARHLATELGTDPTQTNEAIVGTACALLTLDVYALIQASMDGRPADELETETNALVESFTALFLGLPRPTGEE